MGDIETAPLPLLKQLLSHKPGHLRGTSLFEAIECVRQEVPQSLYLAWLLSSRGPLTDFWLLRRILRDVAPEIKWPGTPVSVLPEVEQGTERPDVVALWDDYKLVIEYKVGSPEGKLQIKRYLDTFLGSGDGNLLFLTPSGSRPRGEGSDDKRVRAMGFRRLIELIDEGLADGAEPTERGRVLVCEYRECLKRVLKRSFNMAKPTISDATRLLAAHHDQFGRLMEEGEEQSGQYIEWVGAEAEARLRKILGNDMVVRQWDHDGSFCFRKPQWQTKELEYGIDYAADSRIGQRLIGGYEHIVGIWVSPLDEEATVPHQRAFSERLKEALVPVWKRPISGSNEWYAFYINVPLDPSKPWDDWTASMLDLLSDLAKTLAPALDKFDYEGAARSQAPAEGADEPRPGKNAKAGRGKDWPVWTEDLFMKRVREDLKAEEVNAVERLCTFSKRVADVQWRDWDWGNMGKANVFVEQIGKKPLYRFYTTGELEIVFEANDSRQEGKRLRQQFARALVARGVCKSPSADDDGGVILQASEWVGKVQLLIDAFTAVFSTARA